MLSTYIEKTKFTSRKQYLFDLLFSRNVIYIFTDQSTLKLCYSVCKTITHKPSNVAAAKIFSHSFYILFR